ncbi:MAG: ribonuclease domain-containing protein [Negativibacillus sp.]
MKQYSLWKRAGVLLLALLMALTLFTGCDAEDVELAVDLADALLEASVEEAEPAELPQQESKTPESSQAPPTAETPLPESNESYSENPLDESGRYTSPEDVALYIHQYNKLPVNFITKNEAKKLGWDNQKGNLWNVTDQMSIGGDRFGNYEGALPEAEGRTWKECDVNYQGGYRGSERLLYSSDGLIFYTADHYQTFTQLY